MVRQQNAVRLAAVDPAADALGLAAGLTLADARARVPALLALEMDAAADLAWLGRIADACDRYTPLLALDGADGLILDITGCAHLHGGEAGLYGDLLARLAGIATGARAAIAGTPQAARGLARFGPAKGLIVPRGEEAARVAPLPTAALEIDAETVLALSRAGLRTIGDLAGRPRAPLAARFGRDFPRRLARVLGEADVGITPRRTPPLVSVERRFAEPITRHDSAFATLKALLVHVTEALEQRGEGGRRFEASFFRTDGTSARLAVDTARPTRDPKAVARLFEAWLDGLTDPIDPGYGYDLIRLAVLGTEALDPSQSGLDGHAIEEGAVNALIDRLAARFGAEAVTRFVPGESHLPERAARPRPALALAGTLPAWPAAAPDEPPARPLTLFARPEPIETLAEIPDGPPLRFRWRRVLHDITRAEGPERIAAEWWRAGESALTRDYYRIEDAAGRRFWVFREGLFHETPEPRWFLHGLFA